MTRLRSTVILGVLLALGAACGGKTTTGPVAGDFTVSFTSGTANDGALLLLVTGPVTSVQATGGYQMSSGAAGTNATRVVLTGDIAAGDILKLSVPDVAALSSYTVRIEAAADRTTYSLADPSLYTTTVRK